MTEPSIPHVLDTDPEDVVWGLQTADSLWKRNERGDAIVWLRRAAEAAGAAQHDDRAFALARSAAELSDWIASNAALPAYDASDVPVDSADIEELLDADIIEDVEPDPEPPPLPPPVPENVPEPLEEPLAPPPMLDDESQAEDRTLAGPAPVEIMQRARMTIPEVPEPTLQSFEPREASTQPSAESLDVQPEVHASERPPAVVFASVTEEKKEVKAAEEVHAGILDPWAAQPDPEPRIVTAPISSSDDDEDEEVITSARLEVHKIPGMKPELEPEPEPEPKPEPEPIREPMQAFSSEIDDRKTPVPTGDGEEEPTAIPPAAPIPSIDPPTPPVAAPYGTLDLSAVEALADLPDDTRAELTRVATIHHLALEEEISGFALAFVIEGEIDVAAQIVDAPADRLPKGALLRGKGTIAESVPLRLIGASETAIVATWDAAVIDPALSACPWVDDELRTAANRIQALVGVTLGPIADRLDTSIRNEITSRFTVRELGEGEVFQEAGHAVKEMCIVGQGKLDLVNGDEIVGSVGVGEFAFPTQILGGGSAPTTARAAKGGALVLVAGRAIAQELMVTCPPLLEIFAGM